MRHPLHPYSIRYALALWLATVFALLTAFVVQLEPAQWCGITVWIMFIQTPRLNYSKILWWVFGTVTGAVVAVILIALFHEVPPLFLASLSLWLAICAGSATFVKSYQAYGAVLAGYTCAIVSMSAADHPDMVFHLAVMRVSCIFVGMFWAVVMMGFLLPKQRHWGETLHHLGVHLKETLKQAGTGLSLAPRGSQFHWKHLIDRLSTVEHTLDVTTAETPESRRHSDSARSLVATLSCLVAKAQAVEVLLQRSEAPDPAAALGNLLGSMREALASWANAVDAKPAEALSVQIAAEAGALQMVVVAVRKEVLAINSESTSQDCFILARLEEILVEARNAVHDWACLFGVKKVGRPSILAVHRDYRTATIYAGRMLFAMGLAIAIWALSEWPSGSQLILFIAVVCSLLSLLEHAPVLGAAFLKSALFCFVVSLLESFCLLQYGEGFPILAAGLAVFLLPAAYAYQHPRLIGSAVVSMLIFYGLTMPSNQMRYDIIGSLNNGLALLCAVGCGFFAFHAVPSLTPIQRRLSVMRAIRRDLARGGFVGQSIAQQRWATLMFDRLRLIDRSGEVNDAQSGAAAAHDEAVVALQLGMRQIRLRELIASGGSASERKIVQKVFRELRKMARKPNEVIQTLHAACGGLRQPTPDATNQRRDWKAEVLGEIEEMILLIEGGRTCAVKQ